MSTRIIAVITWSREAETRSVCQFLCRRQIAERFHLDSFGFRETTRILWRYWRMINDDSFRNKFYHSSLTIIIDTNIIIGGGSPMETAQLLPLHFIYTPSQVVSTISYSSWSRWSTVPRSLSILHWLSIADYEQLGARTETERHGTRWVALKIKISGKWETPVSAVHPKYTVADRYSTYWQRVGFLVSQFAQVIHKGHFSGE